MSGIINNRLNHAYTMIIVGDISSTDTVILEAESATAPLMNRPNPNFPHFGPLNRAERRAEQRRKAKNG